MILMLQYTGKLKGNADERLGEEFVGNANIFAFMIMFAVLMQVWLLLYESKGWVQKLALSGMISGTGFAIAKIIEPSFIDFTISAVTQFGAENPRKISAPIIASARVLNGVSCAKRSFSAFKSVLPV